MKRAIVLLMLLAPVPARAAGFLIYDLSAEAMARASAVTAATAEPAAAWFNPAAFSYMPGHGASVGGVMVRAQSRFDPEAGGPEVKSKAGTHVLPTLFGHATLYDRISAGIAVVPSFALGIEWPEDWVGREATIRASIQSVTTNPSVSFRLRDELSFAVGFQAVRAAVELENGLPAVAGGTVLVGGGTWGFGANAALLWRPLPERLHLGFTYRSRVRLAFDGRVDFRPRERDFEGALPDQKGSAEITLPDILTAGIMWRPVPSLALTFDPQYVFWSTYDELVLDFETAPDERLVRNNRNIFTLRFGADWATPVQGLSVRGGFIFDQNPSPAETLAPSLPDANRVDFAAGVGYGRGRFQADLGYLLVWFLPSDSRTGREGPVGTYRTVAHLLGLTLTARFGQ